MSANAGQPPGPEAWQVQTLRLIAFPRDSQHAVQQNWWVGVTGAQPENILDRRQRHEREESGTFQGYALSLSIDLLRVQWTVSPRVDLENLTFLDQPPTMGPFVEREPWFRGLMVQWLAQCPPVKRLAFAATLFHPVNDHPAGYLMLDRYLRWVDIDPESSDLLYRINRRRPSGTTIPQLVINRLSTWSVGKFAVEVRAMVAGQPLEQEGHQVARTERYACALELDINTVPDFPGGLLPQQDLGRIFVDLADAGREIAARGDARP